MNFIGDEVVAPPQDPATYCGIGPGGKPVYGCKFGVKDAIQQVVYVAIPITATVVGAKVGKKVAYKHPVSGSVVGGLLGLLGAAALLMGPARVI